MSPGERPAERGVVRRWAEALFEATGEHAGLLDGVLLGLLTLNGALLGVFGLLFNPLYNGAVPVPMGALLSILILPWLVTRAAEIDPRRLAAGAPLVAWALTVGIVGLTGPGGDVLLPVTWQSVLLCGGGLAAGVFALRRSDEFGYGDRY